MVLWLPSVYSPSFLAVIYCHWAVMCTCLQCCSSTAIQSKCSILLLVHVITWISSWPQLHQIDFPAQKIGVAHRTSLVVCMLLLCKPLQLTFKFVPILCNLAQMICLCALLQKYKSALCVYCYLLFILMRLVLGICCLRRNWNLCSRKHTWRDLSFSVCHAYFATHRLQWRCREREREVERNISHWRVPLG